MSVLRYFITSKAKRSVLKLFLSHSDSAFYTREVARLTTEPLNAVRRELGYLEKAGLLHSRMQGNLKYYEVVKSFPVLAEWQKIILLTSNVDQEKVPPAVDKAEPAAVPYIQPEEPEEDAALEEEVISELEEDEAVEKELGEAAPVPQEGPVAANESSPQPDIITTSTIVDILANEFKSINSVALAVVHGEAAISDDIPEEGIDLLVVGDIPSETLMELLTDIEDDTGVPINVVRMTRSDFDYRNAKSDPLIRRIWSQKKLIVKGRY
jgi:DNA-binding transcriptional ArsR family regulator